MASFALDGAKPLRMAPFAINAAGETEFYRVLDSQ